MTSQEKSERDILKSVRMHPLFPRLDLLERIRVLSSTSSLSIHRSVALTGVEFHRQHKITDDEEMSR
jgi:hypothetical protein